MLIVKQPSLHMILQALILKNYGHHMTIISHCDLVSCDTQNHLRKQRWFHQSWYLRLSTSPNVTLHVVILIIIKISTQDLTSRDTYNYLHQKTCETSEKTYSHLVDGCLMVNHATCYCYMILQVVILKIIHISNCDLTGRDTQNYPH